MWRSRKRQRSDALRQIEQAKTTAQYAGTGLIVTITGPHPTEEALADLRAEVDALKRHLGLPLSTDSDGNPGATT